MFDSFRCVMFGSKDTLTLKRWKLFTGKRVFRFWMRKIKFISVLCPWKRFSCQVLDVMRIDCQSLWLEIKQNFRIFLLILGNCERSGMDVDDVELKMRIIIESDSRYSVNKQLHIRFALGAMICWHHQHWAIKNISNLRFVADPKALISIWVKPNQYILLAFWAFQLINLRKIRRKIAHSKESLHYI